MPNPDDTPKRTATTSLRVRLNAKIAKENEDLLFALEGLVSIIDSAGLDNLSNGVQLGQVSWRVKAGDRMERARRVIALVKGEHYA